MSQPSGETAVVIVGGGPVGLTLSIELSRRGVCNLVLGDAARTSEHPKCNTTNARSMEHFRRLGLAEKIWFGGLPADYPTDIVYLTRLTGEEIARVRFPSPKQAATRLEAGVGRIWPTPEQQHRISQIFLERILLEAAREPATGTVRQGWRVTAFKEHPDHVDVSAVDLATGRSERFRCRWLVGCDGGRSTIRKGLGLKLTGDAPGRREIFGGRMLATYYESDDLSAILRGREGFMYWTLNPEIRSVTVAIDGAKRFLTHFQPADGAPAEDRTPENFLPKVIGRSVGFKVLSSAEWSAGFQLVAERFSSQRTFLAGDAAHLFTPTGGLGMNTGIDDVANLAWKLAAMEEGWGGAHLMASYDLERRPIGFRNTAAATRIADAIAGFRVPAEIEGDDAAGVAARAAAAARMMAISTEEFQTIGVQLGASYGDSPIVEPDGTEAPPDMPTRYVPSARPGARLPHFYFPDGQSLYDRLGRGFSLLCLSQDPEPTEDAVALAQGQGVPLDVVGISEANVTELFGAKFLLVRPDQHVAWRGESRGPRFAHVLSRARGALAPASGESSSPSGARGLREGATGRALAED